MSEILSTDHTQTPIVDPIQTLPFEDTGELDIPSAPVADEPPAETAEVSARKKQFIKHCSSINASIPLKNADEISLPANFNKETRDSLNKTPNINLADSDEAKEWVETVREGLDHLSFNSAFTETLENPEASFTDTMMHNGVELTGSSPKFKNGDIGNLQGERAVLAVVSHLGMGNLFQVPLWNTGIWVIFKPSSESELVELERILSSDKISLGRFTYGLIFSNISSYTIDRVVEFVLAHVYDTTVKPDAIPIQDLKKHISHQDIPSLVWGFICSIYPRGFNYRRACVNAPDKCNYIAKDTLNVTKLQKANENGLTPWQKTHMSARQSKNKDLLSINRYKEELSKSQSTRVVINAGQSNEIAFVLKTPTIAEYVDSGHNWISNIVNVVDNTLVSDKVSAEEKNALISTYGKSSVMRQYCHFVQAIELNEAVIDDRETIDKALNVLSADDEIRSEYVKAVLNYINQGAIAVIGIPVYECPSCKALQEPSVVVAGFENIIPIDPVSVFFTLLEKRLTKLLER